MWQKADSVSRAELEEQQLVKLRRLVNRLKDVPFYRAAFQDRSFDPLKSLESLNDLKSLPFTTKKDIRDNYPFGLMTCQRSEIVRFHASSGTRGKPTIVGYTKSDLASWAELVARSLNCAGVRPGDLIHNSYGYGLFTGGIGLHYGAERLGATVVPASGGKTGQQAQLLADLGARVLCSTPSYALNIAFALEQAGIGNDRIKLELGIFGAEPWTEPLREQLEKRLSITALDIYGTSELTGPGVAMECPAKSGLHIWEDHFLAEVVDPATGEQLPPGSEGELVVTTLSREAYPVLRFKTGDLASLDPDPCACGRTMARMTRVRARMDDMLIVRGVNVYPSEIENILLGVTELAPNYQLVLKREKALDELLVQVEVADDAQVDWPETDLEHTESGQLRSRIQTLLKDNLGLTASIELMRANSITKSEGKAIRLIDKRERQV